MRAVATDERKERRQERAARRSSALRNHVCKLADLQHQECESEQAGGEQSKLRQPLIALLDRETRDTTAEARKQQTRRLPGDAVDVEKLRCARATRGGFRQHRMRSEECREHDEVGEQKDPEAEADDDALRGRTRLAVTGCFDSPMPRDCERGRSGRHQCRSTHAGFSCKASVRAARFARSMRATSSTGITLSDTSRQANTTNVAYAPTRPSAAIHQMCQMSAKPTTMANTDVTKPVGELRGTSMASYCGSGLNCITARACDFMPQYGSSPRTFGMRAKLNSGGGEAIAHSSVRPSQGSPVGSVRLRHERIETMSCVACRMMPQKMTTAPTIETSSHGCHCAWS